VSSGEVQWMNSGSGILHEERIPEVDRLLGVQLWLNLPKDDKTSKPSYNSIKKEDIKEVEIDGGKIRLLAGDYKDVSGYRGKHLPLNYYDIHLNEGAEIILNMDANESVMLFTLIGDVYVEGELVEEKTAVKLTEGSSLSIKNEDKKAQVLYISSKALNEPISWAGPIVMNSKEEIKEALDELNKGIFIKEKLEY